MIGDLLEKAMNILDSTMRVAKKSADDIDQIVLVGGSTRIPRVQEMISSRVPGKINREINPDEVVARGAAIQGGVLAGEIDEIVLLDVTPLTLAIETLGGVATPLIERNTTVPTEKSKTFTTAQDSQPSVEVHVVQGERKMAADNKSLGKFQLTGLPPARRGVPQIEVSFNIDTDGILHVTAKDQATGKSSSITIKESSHLDESAVEQMRRDAEEHAEEDEKRAEQVEVRNQADQLVYSVEKSLSDLGDKVSSEERGNIEEQIRRLKDKLSEDAGVDDLRKGIEELSKVSQELAEKVYKQAEESGETQTAGGGAEPEDDSEAGEYVDAEYEEEETDEDENTD